MTLQLENTVTHKQYEYEVKDNNEGKKLYYQFDIDTLNLDDGEYKLTLIDGKKVVVNDILKIGDFNPNSLQYSKGENTYISINEPDLSAIGYDEKESEQIINKLLISPSADVYSNWDENNTSSKMLFYGNTDLIVCPNINTSNVTNMVSMFNGCSSLVTIPKLNTSKVTETYRMFYNCTALKNVPSLDTTQVTDISYMYDGCYNLKTVGEFSAPKATTAKYLFDGCTSLESIGSYEHYLDLGECKYTSSIFGNCTSLKELPVINCPKITDESGFFGTSGGMLYDLVEVGGCISKHNQNGGRKWAICPNLSQASLQRIINCLYDFVGNGSSTTKGIAFHSNSKALITDEMTAQAAAKGWSIVYK